MKTILISMAFVLFASAAAAQDWTGFFGGLSRGTGGGDLTPLDGRPIV